MNRETGAHDGLKRKHTAMIAPFLAAIFMVGCMPYGVDKATSSIGQALFRVAYAFTLGNLGLPVLKHT